MLEETLAAILTPEQRAAGLVLREHEDGVELLSIQIVSRFTKYIGVAELRRAASDWMAKRNAEECIDV